MSNTGKRLIEVFSTQVEEDQSQAIIRGWEYLPKESDVTRRYSARLGASSATWGGPRKITATMDMDTHPFFRITNVT